LPSYSKLLTCSSKLPHSLHLKHAGWKRRPIALTIRPMMGCPQPAHMIATFESMPPGRECPDDTAMAGRAAISTPDVLPASESSESESGRLNDGSGENFAGVRMSLTAMVGPGSTVMLGICSGTVSGGETMVGTTMSRGGTGANPCSSSSATTDGCFRSSRLTVSSPEGIPRSRLLELFTPTGVRGRGRRAELKP